MSGEFDVCGEVVDPGRGRMRPWTVELRGI